MAYIHGKYGTSEYKSWNMMKQRCYNPNYDGYKDYGARGIKICKRWEVFINFLEDMGELPSPKHSLGRIDNNGDYEPSNCQWQTIREQSLNRSNTIRFTIYEETKTLVEWSEDSRCEISRKALEARYRRSWDIDSSILKKKARGKWFTLEEVIMEGLKLCGDLGI